MEKIEIYKTIITLKRIVEATALYLKKDLQLPALLIEDLDKIGDMGTTIEDYWERTKDTHVVAQIEKINRATLFQVNSWRGLDIEQKTMISITDCIRSLRYIIKQGEAVEPQQKEDKQAGIDEPCTNQIKHYNSNKTKDTLTKIFKDLISKGYLHGDSDLNSWLYICGAIQKDKDIQTLEWTKDQELLAHLIDQMFGDTDGRRLWEISKGLFNIQGKAANATTMKNTVSRIKRDWKSKKDKFKDLEAILKE